MLGSAGSLVTGGSHDLITFDALAPLSAAPRNRASCEFVAAKDAHTPSETHLKEALCSPCLVGSLCKSNLYSPYVIVILETYCLSPIARPGPGSF